MAGARIRLAGEADAESVAAIYGPYCASTIVSFEYTPPAAAEMARRMRATLQQYPWLVLDDGDVAGYAYASRHSERAAYGWSVNTAIYVNPSCHRRGVGRALYAALFDLLRLQGYFKAYAGISLPNPGSVGLHTAVGFTPVGVYERVGYKLGAWHDVAWLQLALRAEQPDPAPPVPIGSLVGTDAFARALDDGIRQFRQPRYPEGATPDIDGDRRTNSRE
jgi:phosphinothricin acetyltransferase